MMNVAAEISTQSVAAVRALQEYGQKKKSKMLFPESDSSIFLVVKYKKIPMSAEDGKRLFIQLPHSDRSPSNTTICLILPDLDKSMKAARDPDVDRQAREWAERLREKYGITAGQDYAKIFTFKQLQREYSMKPDRAKLAKTYDIFLVDRKLMKMAFNFMGKHFKQITKMPLPINSHQNFASKIREAYSTTQMTLAPLKDTVTIRIGNLGQPLAHLEANLLPVVHSLIEHCPGGAVNIRSCQILSMKTSLPVFVDFGSSNEVKLKEPKARVYPEEVDECTTLPDGLAVKVRADGKVTTVEAKTGKEVLYPTEDDEWEKTDDIKPLSKEMLEKLLLKAQMKKKRQEEKKEAATASTGEKKSSVVKGKKRKLDDANDCKGGTKQERIEEPKPEEQEQNAVDEPNLKQIEEVPSVKKQRKRKGSAHGEGEEEGIETGGGAESKEGQAAAGNPDSPSKRRMLKKRKRRQ